MATTWTIDPIRLWKSLATWLSQRSPLGFVLINSIAITVLTTLASYFVRVPGSEFWIQVFALGISGVVGFFAGIRIAIDREMKIYEWTVRADPRKRRPHGPFPEIFGCAIFVTAWMVLLGFHLGSHWESAPSLYWATAGPAIVVATLTALAGCEIYNRADLPD